MNLKLLCWIPSLLLFAGCASIVDGRAKSVHINSNPPGAKVTVTDCTGREVCTQTTPAKFTLKRSHGYFSGEDYALRFEQPGFYPAEVHVKSTMDVWYLGNVLIGGVIGFLIVDPATGAMYTLAPRDISLNLVAVDASLKTPEQIAAAQTKANPPKAYQQSNQEKPAIVERG